MAFRCVRWTGRILRLIGVHTTQRQNSIMHIMETECRMKRMQTINMCVWFRPVHKHPSHVPLPLLSFYCSAYSIYFSVFCDETLSLHHCLCSFFSFIIFHPLVSRMSHVLPLYDVSQGQIRRLELRMWVDYIATYSHRCWCVSWRRTMRCLDMRHRTNWFLCL